VFSTYIGYLYIYFIDKIFETTPVTFICAHQHELHR